MIITRIRRGATRTKVQVKNSLQSLTQNRGKINQIYPTARTFALVGMALRIAVTPVPVAKAAEIAVNADEAVPPSTQAALVFSTTAAESLQIATPNLAEIQVGKSLATEEEEKAQAEAQAKQAAAQAAAARKAVVATTVPAVTVSNNDVVAKLVAATTAAFGADQVNSMLSLVSRESGINPNAYNTSSGACGLFQALPCSKMGGTDIDNQIAWGINYIKARYGNAVHANAVQANQGWY